METKKSKKSWSVDEIRKLIATSDEMVRRSILQLHQCQTPDEQHELGTKYKNDMGFNMMDAEFGSSLAKQIMAGRKPTKPQIAAARKMLGKYAGQLTRIANGRG